jgi:hypothetical protein
VLEVKPVLIVALLNLLIQRLGPLLKILDIIGDGSVIVVELGVTVRLDVFLIAADDGIVQKILISRLLFQNVFILISNKLVVVLLHLVLVIGVQVFDGNHFLQAVYFAEFVYVLKPSLVSHYYSNITITAKATPSMPAKALSLFPHSLSPINSIN